MPAVDQVVGTLPAAFREKYPTTYAIIDGSEVFIETPSDLHLQSSTWSQYKHHNTVKFLVACTPNGAICFISPVYVGLISDKQLTQKSGFLDALKDKPGISIMADRGFTIKDILQELGIDLNTMGVHLWPFVLAPGHNMHAISLNMDGHQHQAHKRNWS